MKFKNAVLFLFVAISIVSLSVFIIHVRVVEEDNYAEWSTTLNSVRLDTTSLERAMLESRISHTSSYDELSDLNQSVYEDAQKLEELYRQKNTLLQPGATLDAAGLIQALKQFREAIFDFKVEISTLRSTSNVFYNTTDELTRIAASENAPEFALALFGLETSLLLDHSSTMEEKQAAAHDSFTRLNSDFPDLIAEHPDEWLAITNDADMIVEHTENIDYLLAEETIIRLDIEHHLAELLTQLDNSRSTTRTPQVIAFAVLISELLGLVAFFVFRSTRLSRKLKQHADELEDIVALRTQALEMAMEDLKTSTAEKEKFAEELRIAHRLEAIGQLAAGIAHEINTPSQFVNDNLQFILEAHTDLAKVRDAYAKAVKEIVASSNAEGVLEKLQDLEDEIDLEFLQDEVPSALKNSLEGMERISKIVKSMKDFSHPGSEGVESIDINQAIETTLSVARNEWKYVANVEKDFAEDLPKVPVVATELNQVLLNIIVNAAHAIVQKNTDTGSDELGNLRITTEYDDKYVGLRIRDDGCGIPQENIDRVFDPFFTTKEVGKGTGQGLSIARKIIVDTHDGLMEVKSELGQFTEFHIRLPLSAEKSGATEDQDITNHSEITEAVLP